VPTHTFMWPGKSGGHGLSTQSSVCRALSGCFGAAIVGLIEIDTESPAIVHYPHKPAPWGVPKVGIESLQPTSITTSAAAYSRLHGSWERNHSSTRGLNSCVQLCALRLHQKTSIRMTQRMNTAVSSKSENPVLLHIHERGVPVAPGRRGAQKRFLGLRLSPPSPRRSTACISCRSRGDAFRPTSRRGNKAF